MKTQQFSVEEYATDHTCKKILFLQLPSSSKLQEQSQGAAGRFSRLDFGKSTVILCLCFLHCMSFGERLGCNLMPYSIITKLISQTPNILPRHAIQPHLQLSLTKPRGMTKTSRNHQPFLLSKGHGHSGWHNRTAPSRMSPHSTRCKVHAVPEYESAGLQTSRIFQKQHCCSGILSSEKDRTSYKGLNWTSQAPGSATSPQTLFYISHALFSIAQLQQRNTTFALLPEN